MPPQSAVKPKQAPSTQPQRKTAWETFWGQFAGQRLTLQCKSGAIVEGTFASLEKNYIKVVGATIIGKSNRIQTDWIIIEINAVAHFHPAAKPDQAGNGTET